MTYPATTYAEGVEITITSGNQLHEIINGDATEEINTESGMVPSVRKALADSMLFKPAIAWAEGSVESDPFQTRLYGEGIYWAPLASNETPISMGTTPNIDGNWFLAPVTGGETISRNTNLLSNHNFIIQSPDDIEHPSVTPTDYVAGIQIFSGVFVGDDIIGLTYIDGRVSWTSGTLYFSVPNSGALEYVDQTDFVASVADFDGKPRTRGVSFALVGDEYRVTVGIDALEDVDANQTLLGSVKFEQGSVATGHDTTEWLTASPNIYRGLWPDTGGSANKGETWQTQTGGSPTGQYFTALQNTTVDPISDDVNWREVTRSNATAIFDTLADLKAAPVVEGQSVRTLGYYEAGDGGGAEYIITAGNTGDGYLDHDIGTSTALLQFSEYPTFEQCGGRFFASRSDVDFLTTDAGLVLNAAVANSRVNGITTRQRGFANVQTMIYIEKSFVMDFGGLTWSGLPNGNCEFVAQTTIGNFIGVFTVKSGVRNVTLRNFKVKCYATSNSLYGIRIGDASYQDGTANICSGIEIESVRAERFNSCFWFYQIFLSTVKDCGAIDPTVAGFYFREGGTSLVLENCSTLNGQYGFYWWTGNNTDGHVYSTMINCVPQFTTQAAYLFRNCTMSMVGCGQEFCSGTIIYLDGTGSLSVDSFNNLNDNINKPDGIFFVTENDEGRFGWTISMQTCATSVRNFSGDKIQWVRTATGTPSSFLSSSQWDFPESCFKSDATDALDRDTWKSGWYYEHCVPLERQTREIERYARNGQSQANITLDPDTDHTIYGNLDASGTMKFKMTIATSARAFETVAEVDAVAAADANEGFIFKTQGGTGLRLGGLYMEGYDIGGTSILVSMNSSGTLVIRDSSNSLVGDIVIERKRNSFEYPL